MDNALQNYKTNSLVAELNALNQQELKFKELFGAQIVQDNEFLKMKLSECNRIWYKHRGEDMTTDEKAVMTVLRFYRRKIQNTLYPGLLTRLFMRTFAFASHSIKQAMISAPMIIKEPYHLPEIPLPPKSTEQRTETEKSPVTEQQQEQRPQQSQKAGKNYHRHKTKNRRV